jgi:hypothetical protein
MKYIIIKFNGTEVNPNLDEAGKVKIYDSIEIANISANKFNGDIILPLTDVIQLSEDALGYISIAKFELGSEEDPDRIEERLSQVVFGGES